jgi:hypothetical protein
MKTTSGGANGLIAGNIIQMESNYKLGLLDGELIEYNVV